MVDHVGDLKVHQHPNVQTDQFFDRARQDSERARLCCSWTLDLGSALNTERPHISSRPCGLTVLGSAYDNFYGVSYTNHTERLMLHSKLLSTLKRIKWEP